MPESDTEFDWSSISDWDAFVAGLPSKTEEAAAEPEVPPTVPESTVQAQRLWEASLADAEQMIASASRRTARLIGRLDGGAAVVMDGLAPIVFYSRDRFANTRRQTLAGLAMTLEADVNDATVVDDGGDVAPDSLLYAFIDRLDRLAEAGVPQPSQGFRSFLEGGKTSEAWTVIRAIVHAPAPATGQSGAHPQSVLSQAVPVTYCGGRSVAEVLESIERLEGLDGAKEMARQFAAMAQFNAARQAVGIPAIRQSRHMAFVGNPGTGKTMVARFMAELLGAISGDARIPFVEADRSMLVGEFLGTSALKTRQVAEAALGGVLFIDEAYSLVGTAESGPDRFAQEALDTLVKVMEDDREDLVVILAGYPEPMSRLLQSNPGLASRVGSVVEFPNYDIDSLERIFVSLAEEQFLVLGEGTEIAVREALRSMREDAGFANARSARNLLNTALRRLAKRISQSTQRDHDAIADCKNASLTTIRFVDMCV